MKREENTSNCKLRYRLRGLQSSYGYGGESKNPIENPICSVGILIPFAGRNYLS